MSVCVFVTNKFEEKQIKSNSENGKQCNGNKQIKKRKINKVMALWSRVGKRSMVGANSNYENQHAMTYRRKPSFNPLSPPWSRCRRRLCTIRLITVIVVPIFFLFENGSEKMIEKTIFKMINENGPRFTHLEILVAVSRMIGVKERKGKKEAINEVA